MTQEIYSSSGLEQTKKHPKYKEFAQAEEVRVRLAVEFHHARTDRGLSQQQLAKLAGTSQKVVSKTENGDVNIGIDLLQRLGRALKLPILVGKSYLIGPFLADSGVLFAAATTPIPALNNTVTQSAQKNSTQPRFWFNTLSEQNPMAVTATIN